jgi:hypothetical protein
LKGNVRDVFRLTKVLDLKRSSQVGYSDQPAFDDALAIVAIHAESYQLPDLRHIVVAE